MSSFSCSAQIVHPDLSHLGCFLCGDAAIIACAMSCAYKVPADTYVASSPNIASCLTFPQVRVGP